MERDSEEYKQAADSLALFAVRIAELRTLLGVSGRQFADRLGLSSGVPSQWENGQASANRDQALRISHRYGVSVDSLFGLDRQEKLQPSPALRDAQQELRGKVLTGELDAPTTSLRIQAIGWLLIQNKAITADGWNDWLQVDGPGWGSIMKGSRIPSDPQIWSVAMLAGWYEASAAWEEWIRTGDSDELIGYEKEDLAKLVEQAGLSGMSAHKLRSLLKGITK
jgi:transcriptional regulator with XRE-family HTH domain